MDRAVGSLTSERIHVRCLTLDEVLVQHNIPKAFDRLFVHVERFEGKTLADFQQDLWRPRILIVKLADTHSDLSATEIQGARLGRKRSESIYVITYKDTIITV